MDQPRKVAKPARGQWNREIKCTCIRGKYILYTDVCICLHTRHILLFGYKYIRARFTAVCRYFQHARFIPIVGAGKRGAY